DYYCCSYTIRSTFLF
nr:immunoglobulin light chain junction region [Macaca mulatta]MOY15492.1 immunoglobulin light chain junction region [Macaca mulatta]MOY16317.1 immunoglobulin light chain junction region [Macaca mulatta]